MEESISGFKTRGTWPEVVEHGERITRALREVAGEVEHDSGGRGAEADESEDGAAAPDDRAGAADDPPDASDARVDPAALADWDEWRPKAGERLAEDVNEKTAEQASIAEGDGEKAGRDPDEDLRTAGEKLSESYERAEAGDDEGAVESWRDSLTYVARAADSAGRRAVRTVEDTVYRRVMTQLAPYYFDNELVSANIQQTTGEGDEPTFVFEVNVNDDELKAAVSERLGEYDDEVDRWHVDTEKETRTVEAAEGVEAPDSEGNSKSTTN